MSEEKNKKFRANFVFNLPESIYNEYMKINNKTTWLTGLIQDYFDKSIIIIKLDENIREKYEKDIYKDFRIQMLLLEFYNRGNINLMINNAQEQILDTSQLTSSDCINENINLSSEKENNALETTEVRDEKNSIEKKQNEAVNIKLSQEIIKDEEESIIEDAKKIELNRAEEELSEPQNTITNEEVSSNNDDDGKTNDERRSSVNAPKGSTGSIADMFKNGLPKNNKKLIK